MDSTERMLSHPRRSAPTPVAAAPAHAFDPDMLKVATQRLASESVATRDKKAIGITDTPSAQGGRRPSNNSVRIALRNVTHSLHSRVMRIRHKGLRELFEHDSGRRLPPHFVPRLRYILTMLDEARRPKDMDRPGLRLHPLKGDRRGQWSVWVSGNWRIVFRFDEGEVVGVDLVDYHGG